MYLPILKFCASSFVSGLLDFALLLVLQMAFSNLLVSVIGARVGSSAANYALNRLFIFSRPGKRTVLKSVTRYYILAAAILALNYGLIYLLHILLDVPLIPAKLATEILLFVCSYWCQRKFVY